MGLVDVLKNIVSGLPRQKRNLMTIRPSELDIWTRGSVGIAKAPSVPYLGYRFVSEIYLYSDLLKTIIRSLVQETFRKGITIVPKFVVKCNVCHTDYDTKVEVCEVCGSDSLRTPNPFEREWMEKFMHDTNFNDQTLVEVLQDVCTDLNIYDNAFLAVVKRYDFNSEGRVVGAEVVEVIRANPENIELVIDREGRPARTDDGRVALVCLEHRDRYVAVSPEEVESVRCNLCKKMMYPAYFAVRKSIEGQYLYYTNGEILHIKKFTHGLGYGLSPIFSVWMKVMTLIKQDFFILTAYHLERSPRGILVLRGQMESIQKAWQRLQEEAKTNPHIIYPLVVEGADKVNRVAEWLDLSFSAKDIDFIQYREEVRRTVGCYDDKTEIFTENGWKRFSDLRKDERIWQVNDDLSLSLVKPTHYFEADYEGTMYRFRTKSLDLLVTPNHNMVVVDEKDWYNDKNMKLQLKRADEVKRAVIPQAIKWEGERIKEFILPEKRLKRHHLKEKRIDGDDYCRFMGIWLAEGSLSKTRPTSDTPNKVLIAQSRKSRYYEDIKNMLSKLPFKVFIMKDGDFVINSKQLAEYLSQFGRSGDKFVPEIIKNATPEQIKLFLEWFVKGDGSKRSYKENGFEVVRVKVKSERLADDIQELFMKIGISATKVKDKRGYFEVNTRCTKNSSWKSYSRIRKENITEEYYKGKIYCVEVPSHKLLVRRNGRIAVCGNSLWGVMPLFHGDTSAGVGLANEGLQIVVTNRAVEREQTLFNEKVLSWLCKQLGVSDWEYRLVPNEGRDVVARLQRETMRIANAERMAQLGYRPVAVKTDDGLDFYYEYQGSPIKADEKTGYIAGKVYQEFPAREIPRYEGEAEHGRPRKDEQRFEGEELARREKTPTTFVVGEGGELVPEEGEVGKSFFQKAAQIIEVPEEYRRYISREDIPKLPKGTRIHEGPRGGLFIDVREVSGDVLTKPEKEPAKEVDEPKPDKIRQAHEEKINQGLDKFVNYFVDVKGFSRENPLDIRRLPEFKSFKVYSDGFESWLYYKKESEKFEGGIEYEEVGNYKRVLDESRGQVISNIVSATGVPEEFAEVVLDVGSLFLYYTSSTQNAAVVDYFDRLYSGDDRPRRTVNRGEEIVAKELQKIITPEKYRTWIEFGKTLLNRMGLVKDGKIKVYRGLGAFEGVPILFARLMGKDEIRFFGGLQSFTLSEDVAENFNKFGVIRLALDVDTVRSGFWFSHYPKELEITATVPEEGIRVESYRHSGAGEIDVLMRKAIDDFLNYFLEYYRTGYLLYLKELKEKLYREGYELRDYGATLVVSQFLEDVYNLLGSTTVLKAISHDLVYMAYKEFASYVARLAEKLLGDLDKIVKELGASMSEKYKERIKKYANVDGKVLVAISAGTDFPEEVFQYLKNKYGEDSREKFVKDVFKDVAPILERLADEFIRLVEEGGEG